MLINQSINQSILVPPKSNLSMKFHNQNSVHTHLSLYAIHLHNLTLHSNIVTISGQQHNLQSSSDHVIFSISIISSLCMHHSVLLKLLFGWENWEEWDGQGMYRLRGRGEAYTGCWWGNLHRWEDNIKMDLQEVECGGMDWIKLAQDRDRWRALVNVVMNLQVPQNSENFLTSWELVSFSRTLLHGVSK